VKNAVMPARQAGYWCFAEKSVSREDAMQGHPDDRKIMERIEAPCSKLQGIFDRKER
jgi:hypothetical protein